MPHLPTRPTVRPVPAAAVAAVVAVTVLAGCGGSGGTDGASSAAPSTTSGPATTSVPSSSTSPSTSGTDTGSATASPTGTGGSGTCAPGSTTVVATPGSGASGTQYEILQFTNSGASSCSLTGFVSVSLLAGGAELGSPVTPSSATPVAVELAPGGDATAQLSGPSTCDAPLSDVLRVTLPGASTFVDVPGQVRACPLSIDPVAPAS